mmetsp:Transcript_39479/g.93670  ORF Transcript_39479/g.93670 Transcript_39479/m.93670 type:complete len:205 (-) Transcript_39479:655-1269(-)
MPGEERGHHVPPVGSDAAPPAERLGALPGQGALPGGRGRSREGPRLGQGCAPGLEGGSRAPPAPTSDVHRDLLEATVGGLPPAAQGARQALAAKQGPRPVQPPGSLPPRLEGPPSLTEEGAARRRGCHVAPCSALRRKLGPPRPGLGLGPPTPSRAELRAGREPPLEASPGGRGRLVRSPHARSGGELLGGAPSVERPPGNLRG